MPAVEGMSGMKGNLSYSIPDHQPDRTDRLDFAYIHLDQTMRAEIHPSIKAAQLTQLTPARESLLGELYTFVGFPWRKSKTRRGVVTTELFKFTGFVTSDEKYEALGCDRREHIVVRFKRRRTFSAGHTAKKMSPHPQGISGGMALKWPRDPKHRGSRAVLKIGGIAHSFYENVSCLVATSMHCVVSVIVGRHPELRRFVDECDDAARADAAD